MIVCMLNTNPKHLNAFTMITLATVKNSTACKQYVVSEYECCAIKYLVRNCAVGF